MQKVCLKTGSVLLCGLLIYNSLGHFIVLNIMHQALRQQMWSGLGNMQGKDLTTFTFTGSTSGKLIVVNKHEIKKTVSKKQTTYVCINDRQEEKLIAKIKQHNRQAHQLPQDKLARIIIDNIIKSAIAGQQDFTTDLCISVQYEPFETIKYPVPGIQHILPPPEFLA